jgi:hypothetical protein
MKIGRLWLGGVVVAVSVVLGGQIAQAGAVTGSEALAATVTGVSNLNTDGTETLTKFVDTGNTGDFSAVSGITFSPSVTVDFTLGTTLTISDAAWGTFTGTLMIDDDNAVTQSRTETFVGTFTPGTNFPGGTTVNSASLVMSFTQSGGVGNSISDSLSLHAPTSVIVPEPVGFAVFGTMLGLVGLVAARRCVRRDN